MEVDVSVRGVDDAVDLVQRLTRRLEDGRPQLHGLVDLLLEAEADRFRGRGVRWRKLSRSALRVHRAHGRGAQPLVLTGRLRESLTRRGAANQIVRVSTGRLTFGTSVWYAKFHQKGAGNPKRTVVGLTRLQKRGLVDELRDLFTQDLNR